jgi:hypothetical protein
MLFLTLILLGCQKYSYLVSLPSLISRNLRTTSTCNAYSHQSTKDYFQKKDYYETLQGGSTSTDKKGGKFETQVEVDIFIENSLSKCSKTDMSDLLRVSADVSKKNRKVSFLKNHLAAIVLQLRELSSSAWNFQEISGVIYGLQYMTGDDEGIMDIVSVITLMATKSIKNIEIMQKLRRQHISMLLYGLQNMNCREERVRNLLSVVATMILDCSDKFNPQAIGNSFYGLQGMSSNSSEVRDVLSALTIKMLSCKENFSAQQLGNVFYGLVEENWIVSTEFISVISFLRLQFRIIVDDISPSSRRSSSVKIATKDLITLSQSIVLLLPDIFSIINTEEYEDLDAMNLLLTAELARRRRDGDIQYKHSKFQSSGERRIYNIAIKTSRNTDIHVNDYLFNIFGGDINLEIPSNGDIKNVIINIQVNGINHNDKTITFCERKDKYLESKGVFVSKIDISVINKMTDGEIEIWMKEIVSNTIAGVTTELGMFIKYLY